MLALENPCRTRVFSGPVLIWGIKIRKNQSGTPRSGESREKMTKNLQKLAENLPKFIKMRVF